MQSSGALIFTDGSSRGNPGPGGWAAIVVSGPSGAEAVAELGGGDRHTTNNRMELTAAIEGLARVPEGSSALVHTDSSYVVNGITTWVAGWKKNGWRTKAKLDVLNKDLWMRLDALAAVRRAEWRYVGGHVGIAGNERCDAIATSFADGTPLRLYAGPLSGYQVKDIADVSHDPAAAAAKKASSSRSGAKAYSYVSKVGGVIAIHRTWAECEKRVKGAAGALYRKSLDRADEEAIIRTFKSS
ncbi:MAG: ribonuclease HI [Patescibacteria group bacterium]|nr:ribonuclease HI [Patescibacteria group bacterium]